MKHTRYARRCSASGVSPTNKVTAIKLGKTKQDDLIPLAILCKDLAVLQSSVENSHSILIAFTVEINQLSYT